MAPNLPSVNTFQTYSISSSTTERANLLVCYRVVVVVWLLTPKKVRCRRIDGVVWYACICMEKETKQASKKERKNEWQAKQSIIKQSIICTFNRLLPRSYICVCAQLQFTVIVFMHMSMYQFVFVLCCTVCNIPFVGSRFCITIYTHYRITTWLLLLLLLPLSFGIHA